MRRSRRPASPVLGWGQFLTVVINFLILAFVIFLLVRSANKDDAQEDRTRPARARSTC